MGLNKQGYWFILFHQVEDQHPGDTQEALLNRPPHPAFVSEVQPLVAQLVAYNPALTVIEKPDEITLTHKIRGKCGLRIRLHSHWASIAVDYGLHGWEMLRPLFDQLTDYVRLIQDHTGYDLYDSHQEVFTTLDPDTFESSLLSYEFMSEIMLDSWGMTARRVNPVN